MVSQPGLEGVLGRRRPVKGANHLNNRLSLLSDVYFNVDGLMIDD
jgi:hypothetical protein